MRGRRSSAIPPASAPMALNATSRIVMGITLHAALPFAPASPLTGHFASRAPAGVTHPVIGMTTATYIASNPNHGQRLRIPASHAPRRSRTPRTLPRSLQTTVRIRRPLTYGGQLTVNTAQESSSKLVPHVGTEVNVNTLEASPIASQPPTFLAIEASKGWSRRVHNGPEPHVPGALHSDREGERVTPPTPPRLTEAGHRPPGYEGRDQNEAAAQKMRTILN